MIYTAMVVCPNQRLRDALKRDVQGLCVDRGLRDLKDVLFLSVFSDPTGMRMHTLMNPFGDYAWRPGDEDRANRAFHEIELRLVPDGRVVHNNDTRRGGSQKIAEWVLEQVLQARQLAA